MLELAKMKQEEDVSEASLQGLFETNLAEYDDDWLKQTAETWVEYKNLDSSIFDVINFMKTTKVTAENIKEVVEKVKGIINERTSIEFGFDEGLDFFNPDSHIQPTSDTFSSGYNYIDLVLGGGFYLKALFCFIGEMKIGKCASYDTKITVRNKKTGLIETVQVGDFHKRFIDLNTQFTPFEEVA
jgi:hypothetical protein